MTWGTPEEVERRNRIRLSVWAFAYEVMDDELASDAAFDALCLQINPKLRTGHIVFDNFFATEFSPATGMWVRKHPDQVGLQRTYDRLKAYRKKPHDPAPATS